MLKGPCDPRAAAPSSPATLVCRPVQAAGLAEPQETEAHSLQSEA